MFWKSVLYLTFCINSQWLQVRINKDDYMQMPGIYYTLIMQFLSL